MVPVSVDQRHAREPMPPTDEVLFLFKGLRKMYHASTNPRAQYSHLQEEMSHACLHDLWQSMRLGLEFLPGMRKTAHTSNTFICPAGCGAPLRLVRSRAGGWLALLHQVRADGSSGELATRIGGSSQSAPATAVHSRPGSNGRSLREPSAVRAAPAAGGDQFAERSGRGVSALEEPAHRFSTGQELAAACERIGDVPLRVRKRFTVDKKEYNPGDKVKLNINVNKNNGTVLLFARPTNGVYLAPKLIRMKGKSVEEEITVVQRDMPIAVYGTAKGPGTVNVQMGILELQDIPADPQGRTGSVAQVWQVQRQAERLAQGFQGEAGTMAVFGIGGGDEAVHAQRFRVHYKAAEIIRVGIGALCARRGQLGHAFVDPALLEARFHFDRHVRVVLGGFRLQAVAGGARHGECGGENEQGKSCGHAVSEDKQCAIRVPYGEPIFLFSLSGKTV